MSLSLIATCALGLEPLLADELVELGVDGIESSKGAVSFRGGWATVWRANLWLRTANRVLVELGSWPARNGDELAAGADDLVRGDHSWEGLSSKELFDPRLTLAVRATTQVSKISDPRWAALKAKDGLVDGQRARYGSRSTVERNRPDLQLRVWLHRDRASLLLDTSGEPLDHRGYRMVTGVAPVREQIAAACVLASGWRGGSTVIDPMCGTGTLLIEAGWLGLGVAPGSLREHWAFERLPSFEARAFESVRAERRHPDPASARAIRLRGVDRLHEAVRASRRNLEAAGLADRAEISVGDGFELIPPNKPGLVLVNPPYGARLESDRESWKKLGDLLKKRYAGWKAVVLAGDPDRGKWIGLRPQRKIPVKNGPIETRILVFELY